MKEYFSNIYQAAVSIAKGMGITIRAMVSTPQTVQYPEIDVLDPKMPGYKGDLGPVQERFRGVLDVHPDSCIADHLCEKTCPIACIQIDDVKGTKVSAPNYKQPGKDVAKMRHLTRFDIHIGRCMHCGLCVDVCPTGAIHFTREFEDASSDYKKMVHHTVTEEYKAGSLKKAADEEARKKAEEAKKAAEAQATPESPGKKEG